MKRAYYKSNREFIITQNLYFIKHVLSLAVTVLTVFKHYILPCLGTSSMYKSVLNRWLQNNILTQNKEINVNDRNGLLKKRRDLSDILTYVTPDSQSVTMTYLPVSTLKYSFLI